MIVKLFKYRNPGNQIEEDAVCIVDSVCRYRMSNGEYVKKISYWKLGKDGEKMGRYSTLVSAGDEELVPNVKCPLKHIYNKASDFRLDLSGT